MKEEKQNKPKLDKKDTKSDENDMITNYIENQYVLFHYGITKKDNN